jgi:hypothetical protein
MGEFERRTEGEGASRRSDRLAGPGVPGPGYWPNERTKEVAAMPVFETSRVLRCRPFLRRSRPISKRRIERRILRRAQRTNQFGLIQRISTGFVAFRYAISIQFSATNLMLLR